MSNLAKWYIKYAKELYHSSPNIPQKQAVKFMQRELELLDSGISLDNYAKTVSHLLMQWCVEKDLYYIPAHIFVSEYAFTQYLKFRNKASVKLDGIDNSQLVFFTELQLCTVLFNSMRSDTPTTETTLVAAFKASSSSIVCQDWKDLPSRQSVKLAVIQYYMEYGPGFKTRKVMDDYNQLYGVYLKHASKDLQLKRKRLPSLQRTQRDRLAQQITELEIELMLLERNLNATTIKQI